MAQRWSSNRPRDVASMVSLSHAPTVRLSPSHFLRTNIGRQQYLHNGPHDSGFPCYIDFAWLKVSTGKLLSLLEVYGNFSSHGEKVSLICCFLWTNRNKKVARPFRNVKHDSNISRHTSALDILVEWRVFSYPPKLKWQSQEDVQNIKEINDSVVNNVWTNWGRSLAKTRCYRIL